jgi:hypothetical protein
MVAYTQSFVDQTDIYCSYSTDGGGSFSTSSPLPRTFDNEKSVALTVSDSSGRYHAAFWRAYDIEYTYTDATSPLPWAPTTLINEANWASSVYSRPAICVNPTASLQEEARMAWTDYRGTFYDIYFDKPGDNPPMDSDNDGILDSIEDADHDGFVDADETDPNDADTDDDGLSDGVEDANHNGSVDDNETDPRLLDTDNDGLQDGTEIGETSGTSDTDGGIFIPDADGGATTTDPLDDDTDNDGILDGDEDINHNGAVDPGETDPNVSDRSKAMPWIPLLLLDD